MTTLRIPPNSDVTLGMTCIARSVLGVTVWAMTAVEQFANPAGATEVVTNLKGRKALVANTEMKISYLKAVKIGERLTCKARVIGGGQRVAFVEAEVTDSAGTLLAKASSTYLTTSREQSPSDGRSR